MKKLFLILLLGSLLNNSISAQSRKEYVIKPGQTIAQVIPVSDRYFLPAFEDGAVFYRNGRSTVRMKMNYNLVANIVAYISPLGDTVAFKGDSPVEFAAIGHEEFFYDERYGYLNIIGEDDSVKLGSLEIWDVIRKEKLAADGYGSVSQTVAVSSTTTIPGTSKTPRQIVWNENTVFAKKRRLFLIDSKDQVHKANRAGFNSVFPELKEQIKTFKGEEGTPGHFDEEEQLYKFCIALIRNQPSKQ